MKKNLSLISLALTCAMSSMAQSANNDTLRMDTSMFRIAEVTVEAQSVIQKVDKQVLLPNREQRKASRLSLQI